jgi:hypothetical protein
MVCLTMKLTAIRLFETSVIMYQSTQHSILEDLNVEHNRCENLKVSQFLDFVTNCGA